MYLIVVANNYTAFRMFMRERFPYVPERSNYVFYVSPIDEDCDMSKLDSLSHNQLYYCMNEPNAKQLEYFKKREYVRITFVQ